MDYAIQCYDCNARGPIADDDAESIDQWNRRVPIPEATAPRFTPSDEVIRYARSHRVGYGMESKLAEAFLMLASLSPEEAAAQPLPDASDEACEARWRSRSSSDTTEGSHA